MNEKTANILKIFEILNLIPRCSKNEQAISNWLCQWAEDNNFSYKKDKINNIVIDIPGTPGYENSPILILQGHMDMVCEKNHGTVHDFTKDPIVSTNEDGWLKAKGTTLGADNGIAIAIALNLALDSSIEHPPLELLFTVDEETGLTGANNLGSEFLKGRILINIDSEDEGVFTIGCAGGRDTHIHLPLSYEKLPSEFISRRIKISNLAGGHSGIDINKQKANANLLLGRFLLAVSQKIKLISMNGGTAHNALAREAYAEIAYNISDETMIQEKITEFQKIFKSNYATADPNIKIDLEDNVKLPKSFIKDELKNKIILLLHVVPHGVQSMNTTIEGLVESSSNLARISSDNSEFSILSSQRSSSMSLLDNITDKIESAGRLANAKVYSGNGYPSWDPNFDSPLLSRCKNAYKTTFQKDAVVEIIHAGLECGIIGSKYDGMDMISIGPTIKYPHSPDEKLKIDSLDKIQIFLEALFRSFSK